MSVFGPVAKHVAVRTLTEAEWVLRVGLRNGLIRAMATYEGCTCGECDDDRAMAVSAETLVHLDRAVQELEAAFDLLGIPRA